jgi:protein-L-isoaspartate O-methyltransferase
LDYSIDRIIVTCGIDHIPPPLLSQLRPNGIMVIPVGPARPARHSQGDEAAGCRRLDPGGAIERLQQGRFLRDLHQARMAKQSRALTTAAEGENTGWASSTRPNIPPRVEVLGLATQ